MGYFLIKNIISTVQAVFSFQDKKYLLLCVKSMEGEHFCLYLVKMLLKMEKQTNKEERMKTVLQHTDILYRFT